MYVIRVVHGHPGRVWQEEKQKEEAEECRRNREYIRCMREKERERIGGAKNKIKQKKPGKGEGKEEDGEERRRGGGGTN